MTESVGTTEREHFYTSEATVLSGSLQLPLEQEIQPQAFISLPTHGGYFSQTAKAYRLEGALSYTGAHTQVGGNRETKPGHGWSTLATSVVEGLNVLDVVTADRVIAQVSTEHPLVGYVPHISFLGTRFENLRIAGHPVKLDLDLEIFGKKPEDDAPYTKSPGCVERVSRQHARIQEHQKGHSNLISGLIERYNRVPESFANSTGDPESVECSLVNQAEGEYPGHSCGHVIEVPNFGTIYLATVRLEHSDPHPVTRVPKKTTVTLSMIRMKMGCLATGQASLAMTRTNGGTKP